MMKHLTSRIFATTLMLGMTLSAMSLQADTLVIPLGHQATDNVSAMPQRGQTKGSVAQRHGEPSTRHAAVGQPPITRWDYPGYSVYFEYDRVIDSVRHRQSGSTLTP